MCVAKYIIGNIQHVLNINRHTNRATSLLVQALYIAIHFMIKSNNASAENKISIRIAVVSFIVVSKFSGIVVMCVYY